MNEANTTVAEWVLPGHPDKLCDALADRIVGEVMREDPYGQCGIEAACAFDHVFVTGLIGYDRIGFELSTLADIEQRLVEWVRDTYRSAGYGGRWDPLPDTLQIDLRALRIEQRGIEWQELRHLSDDQCICVGYAQDTPQTDYMPGALWTARRIARALHARQQATPQGPIGPDGKVIVRGLEHEDGSFQPLSVSVSLHHAEDADWLALRRHAQGALHDALDLPGAERLAPMLEELRDDLRAWCAATLAKDGTHRAGASRAAGAKEAAAGLKQALMHLDRCVELVAGGPAGELYLRWALVVRGIA